MGESCTIKAHVKKENGEIVESRLFNDLLHYTSDDRELSKKYYAVGTDERFLSQVRDSEEFHTDENGEITFNSLRILSKMDLETDKVVQALNQDIGEGEYTYDKALSKVQNFNENSGWADKMLATMFPLGNGKYYVSVVPKVKTVTNAEGKEAEEGNTVDEQKKLHDVVRNEELERRIKDLLRRHRVSVKFLEDKNANSRYSTVDAATKLENGLYGLIELNEQGYTTDELAEEAGHFAVGALGENPLVGRLENLLKDPSVQREALGEDEYDSANLGNNPAREVAGRLVGKALQRKLDNNARYKVLANRIANIAKQVFYNITGNEARWIAAKAEQVANKIAYQFIEGNNKFSVENAINIEETMQHSNQTTNQKVYKQVMDEFGRMVKQLEAIDQDQFTGNMRASQAMAILSGTNTATGESALAMEGSVNALADTFAFDGIVQALVQLTDYLGPGKEIDNLLKSVNLDNPSEFYANMASNGRKLRQARAFLQSAEIIVDTIREALNPHNLDGSLKLANGVSLTDVKYQDENGTWRSINLEGTLRAAKQLIHDTLNGGPGVDGLKTLEQAYFAKFCEDVYGSKYITTSTGLLWKDIWNGSKSGEEVNISIDDMVLGNGMDDIDIFHRYLGTMSNNPDIIGQIVDKLVKTSNKMADDKTLRYRERLAILDERAERLGLNTEDLVERDENGEMTGNLITPPVLPTQEGNREDDFIYNAYMDQIDGTPYDTPPCINYGKWEKDREEWKKAAWEEFKKQNPDWENLRDKSKFSLGYKWDEFLRRDKKYSMKKWNAEHSIRVNVKDDSGEILYVKWVPNLTYASDAWDNLTAKYKDIKDKKGNTIDSLRQWIDEYRKIKEELDSMLPVGTTVRQRLPQFRGTFMSSVRNSAQGSGPLSKTKAWLKTFSRRVVLESFVETAEEQDYGDMHTLNSKDDELLGTKLNYEDERALRLPVFGINKMEHMADLSTDLIGSMSAYAAMATSYKALSSVVDALEVGREVLFNRNIKGKDTWAEKAARGFGRIVRKASGRHETKSTGEKNRAYARYIKYLEKQVYGITATHYGITLWGKRFVLNKIIQNMSSLGGTLFLKGNIPGGVVNTLTGFNNIFKEAIVGDYATIKDWKFAHRYYYKYFLPMWTTDLGKLRKENKLSLFLEMMNAQNSNVENFRNWRTSRSRLNNFYRMAGYLPYSSGDHYMQAMSYLMIAHGTQLYNTDGNASSNLWDAYQKTKADDEYGKKYDVAALEFSRNAPIDAKEINTDLLNGKGVFLKPATPSTVDFEDWLMWQDAKYANPEQKAVTPDEYNDYRKQYNSMSNEERMKFKAQKYDVLKSILQKTEQYLANLSTAGPLASVPVYTAEEQQYLTNRNVGTGNYADILQTVRDDIFSIIWTKADESSYMDKCREINIRLHGIYNEQDKTVWHQHWYTNAFLAMKGWALGYLEMMYSPNHYSTVLGKNVEGFVNTAAKLPMSYFIGRMRGGEHIGFKDMLISMIAPWSKRSMQAMQEAGFTEDQNMNARRFVSSWALIATLWVLQFMTAKPSGGDGDDDDDESILEGFIHYLAFRTLLEQEAFLEAGEAYVQSGQLADLAPVGLAAVMDLYKLVEEGIGALVYSPEDDPYHYYYHRDDKNERYAEEESKFHVHLIRLIPYLKSVWALQHPYEAKDNYEFGRKLRTR